MKKEIRRVVFAAFIGLATCLTCVAEDNGKALYAKGEKYESKKQYVHALGSYYDAIDSIVPGQSEDARNAYEELSDAIERGIPGWGDFSDEFDMYDGWLALCTEFEQYWTENCPYGIVFELEKGERDMATRTASYNVYVRAYRLDKYEKIKEILQTGLKKRWRNDWTDISKNWPERSVFYREDKNFNKNGVSLIKPIRAKRNSSSFEPLIRFGSSDDDKEKMTDEQYYGAVAAALWAEDIYAEKKTRQPVRTLYDVKFNITDENGTVLLTSGRTLIGSQMGYTFTGVPQSTMKILDSGNYRIVPTGLWLEYGKLTSSMDFSSRTWLKSLPEISIDLRKAEFTFLTGEYLPKEKRDIILSELYGSCVDMGEFYIMKTEVTEKLLAVILNSAQNRPQTNIPVQITYSYALACCNYLSKIQGLTPCYSTDGDTENTWGNDVQCDFTANGWRLPTEEEYKSARGSYEKLHEDESLHSVAIKKPNSFGLYNMRDNSWEWGWGYFYQSTGENTRLRYNIAFGGYDEGVSYDKKTGYRYQIINYEGGVREYNKYSDDFAGFRMVRTNIEGIKAKQAEQARLAKEKEEQEAKLAKEKAEQEAKIEQEMKERKAKAEQEEKEAKVNQPKIIGTYITILGDAAIHNFVMGATEVTQKMFEDVTGEHALRDNPEVWPVKASWYAAVRFCNLLSKQQGLTPCYSVKGKTDVKKWGSDQSDYTAEDVECNFSANGWRLPTDAEWEYAAKGGPNKDSFRYSGSNNISDVAWFYSNSNSTLHEVALKKPNSLGLYDMSGNLSEWCWDGTDTRDLRGGSYINTATLCAATYRDNSVPTKEQGFRIVRNDSDSKKGSKDSQKSSKSSKEVSLGFTPQTLTKDVRKQINISDKKVKGVVVRAIKSGSPASAMNLRDGDVITAVNGKKINDEKDFKDAVNNKKNKTLTFDVNRNGMCFKTKPYTIR